MNPFAIEILRGHEARRAFLPEYSKLYAEAEFANPFFSPAWLTAWHDSLGKRFEPLSLCIRHSDRLLACLPFFVVHFPFLGKGLWAAGADVGDVFDAVRSSGSAPGIAAGFTKLLQEFRFLWLPLVGKSFAEELSATRSPDTIFCIRKRTARLLLHPAEFQDFSAYLDTRFGSKTRQSFRREARKLATKGSVSFPVWDASSDRKELLRGVDAIISLAQKSWQALERSGPFRNPSTREFYRSALLGMAREGSCRISALSINDAPIAYEIGMQSLNSYAMHSMGYDPAWGELSPGRTLLLENIRSCFERGIATFDFLQNDQYYKRKFAPTEDALMDLIVLRNSTSGKLANAILQKMPRKQLADVSGGET